MAAFIDNENQKLLWDTLHKVPLFLHNVPVEHRSTWFKQVIAHFYEQVKFSAFNKNELDALNKDVIRHIMQQLKTSFVQNTTNSSHTLHRTYNEYVNHDELNAIPIDEDVKKTRNVSWEDENNGKIIEKMQALENKIENLQNELQYMKKKVYGDEVVHTINNIMDSLVVEN
jgi:hypothetical protein